MGSQIRFYTKKELEVLPTISFFHPHELKINQADERVWIGYEIFDTANNRIIPAVVTIEERNKKGDWVQRAQYEAR